MIRLQLTVLVIINTVERKCPNCLKHVTVRLNLEVNNSFLQSTTTTLLQLEHVWLEVIDGVCHSDMP